MCTQTADDARASKSDDEDYNINEKGHRTGVCSTGSVEGNPPDRTWPESDAGIWSRWTFSYMSRILSSGNSRVENLSQDDLYHVPRTMEANTLKRIFMKTYYSTSSQRKLLTTLWHVAAPTLIPAGFCELITVICQVSLPLVVQELLHLIEEKPSQNIAKQGMVFAVAIFLILIVNGFGNHRHRHLALKSGVTMRAALVTVLYDHTLALSPKGKVGLSSGNIANLIAVDTQKMFDVAQEIHLIWALPLSIVLVTLFLVLILGPVTLIGIAVLVLLVPVVERVTSRMLKVRRRRAKVTDKRVAVVSAMLQGIKITKLGNLEENYKKQIQDIRTAEIKELRKELAIWALTLVLTVSSPVLASSVTFATWVLLDEENILTASNTFSVLLLFSALRFPINYAGQLAGKAVQALSAMHRINLFLERESGASNLACFDCEENTDTDCPLLVRDAAFSTTAATEATEVHGDRAKSSAGFTVSVFDFAVKKGEVLAVCGPVASGKSTLINGIIGEATATAGSRVKIHGSIAFAPQTPFILNATFRENILFGRDFDRSLYDRVIHACCLQEDILQLGESEDLTEIGERGVTLSGGQKQRINLARAAYAQADLILLDDPLSALDAAVGRKVFERLIKSPNAFFRNSAVVLVTHASHFLNRVDNLLVVVEGESCFYGNWQDLVTFQSKNGETQEVINFFRDSVQELHENEDQTSHAGTEPIEFGNKDIKRHDLMSVEEREHGLSSLTVWLLWFRRAGGLYFFCAQLFFMAIDRFSYVATEYWLARWTEGAQNAVEVFGVSFAAQTDGLAAQYDYLRVYGILILASVITTLIRSEWAVTGGTRAAKSVFSTMIASILRAPMSYFETTPMGRILNRCTFDIDVVDTVLTQSMSMFMISCSWYVAGVVVMCSILYWVILVIVPVTGVYWLLMLHYRKSGADLQRLDAMSRSPIQAMVHEGVDGRTTIRVFKQELNFINRFRRATDENSSALLNLVSAQRWLGIRIELLGSVVVLVSSSLVVSLNETLRLDPGLVGLLIIWSSNFTITLGFLVDTFAATEAAITAIERVDAMANLPEEKPMMSDIQNAPPNTWPHAGDIKFEQVSMRYRQNLPLALDELTFSIPAGERCGIVGRTGAGKSSLSVALFRLVEIEMGRILLDGIDLAKIGLSDVRGRRNGMVIIPQDPFLTGSTLRECVDPFELHSNEDVFNALEAVRLAKPTEPLLEKLRAVVEEGGANFSAGERQLLNLARALLSKPRVLVLDEATASVDGETDAFIQEMLRSRFASCTLLTIAHRLHTIMDYDTIVVMENGKAVEQGSPQDLLDNNGVFAELINATGRESANALRSLASNQTH